MAYQLTWITPYLATGSAPMSFDDLDAIKAQGVDAIVNLCGEFCDLHEIEEKTGFEVYFLPIPDETAPDMAAMEQALAWLDEAIYLGKKVLVHCRHGIGRTGTFVTAYLLRRGLGLKMAGKRLARSRATPTNYAQWQFVKKYGRESGLLTIREPLLDHDQAMALAGFLAGYAEIVRVAEAEIAEAAQAGGPIPRCGSDHAGCCGQPFQLGLIEAVALSHQMNRRLASRDRQECIARATEWWRRLRQRDGSIALGEEALRNLGGGVSYLCPLNREERCLLYDQRPLRCRLHGVGAGLVDPARLEATLAELSAVAVAALGGQPGGGTLSFTSPEVLSGRFVQRYFHALTGG